ncbi:conserved Plasmodium protein, unknown function [Plasmodium vinckei vinckei]|uniref:Uncharacterized protein n=1 Tax=Plasmodium vinckei vinckei TaxID=54757 RepID=A0A449BQY1_PLAVN|nr:conserved Plasmodium protein, unknown function [Plasmodium vinckei vinckei]KEG01661.1 hypothetical protein YYE_03178 [Plasmodium vinckei vinckei]VEV55861.1 conserved Plasmodium protein, unknown function [Plasmodium vinckei vinckei]
MEQKGDRKKKKKKKEKEKDPSYFSDTITFCGTFMRDSMISAAEVVQNNYYPIKESLINIYDQYFSENNHHSNTRITGNVPIFMVKASDIKPK